MTDHEATESSCLVPCFSCGKDLVRVHDVPTQPYGGLTFIARGNYGSRIFDPFAMMGTLHIIVCDECAAEHVSRVVAVAKEQHRPTFKYRVVDSFLDFREEIVPDE